MYHIVIKYYKVMIKTIKFISDALKSWSSERHFLYSPTSINNVYIILLNTLLLKFSMSIKIYLQQEIWLHILSFISR